MEYFETHIPRESGKYTRNKFLDIYHTPKSNSRTQRT